MPLAPTAPWIIPPDYTGAMARGAQLGLSARNQDREEKSAADRLKLAYDQLDRHEKIASANAAEKLAFETKKLDLMGEYNKQRLEAQAAKVKPTPEPKPFHIGTKLVDPTGAVLFDANKGALTDVDKLTLQSALTAARAAQLKLADPTVKGEARKAFSNHINSIQGVIGDITKRYSQPGSAGDQKQGFDMFFPAATNALDHAIKPGPFNTGYVTPGASAPTDSAASALKAHANPWWIRSRSSTAAPSAPAAPSKVTTKEQFDSLEPGAIYIGEDGKRYRKPQAA